MDHQIVVLAAADRAGRPGGARARHNLHEVGVDVAAAAAGLVDGGGPQLGQLGENPAQSALTTCGVTRWNASACWMSALPDERRAWLPRWSARWA